MANLVAYSRFDANSASTGGNGDTTLTVASGDVLVAIVTYTNGDATVTLPTTWGTWAEDTSLQKLTGNRWRVYYINSVTAATGTPSLTLDATRDVVGLLVIQVSGTSGYVSGVVNDQSSPGTGTAILTSTSISVSNNSYLFGLSWDASALSGEASPVLSTGNGFTEQLTAWVFPGAPNKLRAANRSVASGSYAITFNSSFGSHFYRTMLIAFSTASLSGSLGQFDPEMRILGWF